jgi:hypothetical protein
MIGAKQTQPIAPRQMEKNWFQLVLIWAAANTRVHAAADWNLLSGEISIMRIENFQSCGY